MFHGKKGDVVFGLKNLISLVLAAIVLVFIFVIGVKIWSQFSGTDLDEASINNFDNLVEQINKVMDTGEPAVVPFYIRGSGGQNYGLFGFVNKDYAENIATQNYLTESCGWVNQKVEKDYAVCSDTEACLCLVQVSTGVRSQAEVIDCFSNITIDGFFVDRLSKLEPPYAGYNLENTHYSTLVVWGTCSTYGWGVRPLYIRREKIEEGSYHIIFSSEEIEPVEFGGGDSGGAGASGSW
jgi:hypothetical protein